MLGETINKSFTMCLAPLRTACDVSNIAQVKFEAISSGVSFGSSNSSILWDKSCLNDQQKNKIVLEMFLHSFKSSNEVMNILKHKCSISG